MHGHGTGRGLGLIRLAGAWRPTSIPRPNPSAFPVVNAPMGSGCVTIYELCNIDDDTFEEFEGVIALADKISKSFGGRILYSGATLQLNAGERWGLVGPNGAGKTTLLRIIMGEEQADEGTVSFAKDVTIGYLEQETHLAGEKSALAEVIDSAVEIRQLEERIEQMEHEISSHADDANIDGLLERYGAAQDRYERLGGYELDARARQILGGLGFPVADFDKPAKEFSGGWQMRIALSKLL